MKVGKKLLSLFDDLLKTFFNETVNKSNSNTKNETVNESNSSTKNESESDNKSDYESDNESTEHRLKSKIEKIFVNEEMLEEYSVKIYEIDPCFSKHYEKK